MTATNIVDSVGTVAGEKKITKSSFSDRSFTLALFFLSFAIVLVKLVIYYGTNETLQCYLDLSNENFNARKLIQSTINASINYENLFNNKAVNFVIKYYWLLRALMSGIAVTAVTWLILYKDSSIPGVNPPSPFSPKKRSHYYGAEPDICMHINYLLGLVIGVIIFLYMCF